MAQIRNGLVTTPLSNGSEITVLQNGRIIHASGAVPFTVANSGASFSVSQTSVSWTPPSLGTLVGSPTYFNGQSLGTVLTDTNRTQYFTVTVPNDPQWTNASQDVTFSLSDIQEATAAVLFTVSDTGASFSVNQTTVSWTSPSVGTLTGQSPTYSNGQNLGTVSVDTNRIQTFNVIVPVSSQWSNSGQTVTFTLSDIQEATALPTFSFSDGYVANSFSVNYNGVASATLQGGATGLTMSPSSFQPSCSSVLRSSTVSFVVPSGYANSNDTLSNVESATQPSYSSPAISANMVVASGSLTNISSSGASGTHTVTITNPVATGEWNIVYSGTGITPSVRSGCGDRTSLSWSVAANTGAARSGTITLYAGSSQSTVLATLNWSQDTGIVYYSSSYDRGTSSSNVCNGIGSATLVYHSNDRSPISFGDAIYSNSSLSASATAGWYSDGDEVGYWSGSAWSNTGFCGL